jgi:WD40 repeat protein
VHYAHREWWPILGNWPTTGYQGDYFGVLWDQYYPDTNPCWSENYLFHPWVQGPESAHVVWQREIGGSRQGGIIGAYGTQEGQTIDPGVPDVVYGGRCYEVVTKAVGHEEKQFLQCYDLRTGEIHWENLAPSTTSIVWIFGIFPIEMTVTLAPQYVTYITPSESTRYGEVLAQSATHNVELVGIYSDRLYKWDPYTGAITGNYSIDPLEGGEFHNQLDGYVLTVQDLGSELPSDERYRLINWTTGGSSSSIAGRIVSNTSYARSSLPSYIDWNTGIGVSTGVPSPEGIGAWYGLTIDVYNLLTGELMRTITSNHPDTSFSPLATCVDHGKVAIVTQGGAVKAWDLYTGQVAWTFQMDFPWGATGFGVYGVASAYGMFFRPSYDGLYAIDWETGELVWKCPRYTRAAFESPYTDVIGGAEVNPGMTNVRIADGKVYIYDGEHSVDQPRDRGWSLWCINATNGEILWDFPIVGTTAFGQDPSTGPIVDGYLVFPSSLGIQFCFGRGKSATTVTAPKTEIPLGSSIMIEGSVLDLSPAQPGTPCVAQESMRTQMEYLHFNAPIAGIWGNETITGVPVSLTAIGEDGTTYDLGTAVTNGYSGVFGMAWAPPAEGEYEIIASFGPDESYGSSSSTTAVLVGPEAEAYPTPVAPEQPVDNSSLLYGILAAVIVAIVLGIVAVLFTLKK